MGPLGGVVGLGVVMMGVVVAVGQGGLVRGALRAGGAGCGPARGCACQGPRRLEVTEGKLDLPDPSGPVRIPDRRVIAQARVAFEVRLDNARPDGTGAC